MPKANQEIVFQVVDSYQNQAEIEQSLEEITEALKKVGVDEVNVVVDYHGIYHISYYSEVPVSSIKGSLSKSIDVAFQYSTKTPLEKQSKGYSLDIFSLEGGQPNSWDFEGTQVYSPNFKSDRSQHLNVFNFPHLVKSVKLQNSIEVFLNANRSLAFILDNTSHTIPEVRAGPAI